MDFDKISNQVVTKGSKKITIIQENKINYKKKNIELKNRTDKKKLNISTNKNYEKTKQQNFIKNNTKYHKIIIVFCILAAIRVFIYSSAFPFFNNVDEHAHFDLLMKYSQVHIPRSLEVSLPKSVNYIVTYESPEYMCNADVFADKQIPPPNWKVPKEKIQKVLDSRIALRCRTLNHESSQPPLYYIITGIWSKLGSLFGFNGGLFLYWIRWLNIILIVALVWIAYLAASWIFPDNKFIVLGVPLLVAIMPQDTYYSIQNDVLSPFCFGLAFIFMIRFFQAEIPTPRQGIQTGLALAATILVKTCNLPLLIVETFAMLFIMYRLLRKNKLLSAALSIGLFVFCALIPVFIWFALNLSTYGDLTATASKIKYLGWTYKSFSEWFNHPIFTPHGAWIFWSDLIDSFWRGELMWSGKIMMMPVADVFYWLSSLIFIVMGIIVIFHKKTNNIQRIMSWFAFWSFISLVIFMGLLSVEFDFGSCFYPSHDHPYFTSGRLISAALIPFLLLYVQGLNWAFSWIKSENLRFCVIIIIAVFITVSEIIVNWGTFFSQYNFFHM